MASERQLSHLTDYRLDPLPTSRRRGGCASGAWLSSSSATASLFLFSYAPESPIVLLISLNGNVHEEHFVDKLHLSFPQITCGTSRVVVASYKDSVGQIQKFAMRFLNSSESLLFINSMKESMKDVGNIGQQSSGYISEVPCQNGFTHSDEVHDSAATELSPAQTASVGNLLVQPSSSRHEVECTPLEETSAPVTRKTDRYIPLSFLAFLTNSPTNDREAMDRMESDLSNQVKNLPGSSFNALLGKLDRLICLLEGDLALKV